MMVSSGIEFKNFEKAKNEIFAQLDDVKKGNFTQEELNIAKEYVINSNTAAKDSPLSLKLFYVKNIIAKRDITLSEANKKISAVTKEDIINAFKKVEPDTIYFLTGQNE